MVGDSEPRRGGAGAARYRSVPDDVASAISPSGNMIEPSDRPVPSPDAPSMSPALSLGVSAPLSPGVSTESSSEHDAAARVRKPTRQTESIRRRPAWARCLSVGEVWGAVMRRTSLNWSRSPKAEATLKRRCTRRPVQPDLDHDRRAGGNTRPVNRCHSPPRPSAEWLTCGSGGALGQPTPPPALSHGPCSRACDRSAP